MTVYYSSLRIRRKFAQDILRNFMTKESYSEPRPCCDVRHELDLSLTWAKRLILNRSSLKLICFCYNLKPKAWKIQRASFHWLQPCCVLNLARHCHRLHRQWINTKLITVVYPLSITPESPSASLNDRFESALFVGDVGSTFGEAVRRRTVHILATWSAISYRGFSATIRTLCKYRISWPDNIHRWREEACGHSGRNCIWSLEPWIDILQSSVTPSSCRPSHVAVVDCALSSCVSGWRFVRCSEASSDQGRHPVLPPSDPTIVGRVYAIFPC